MDGGSAEESRSALNNLRTNNGSGSSAFQSRQNNANTTLGNEEEIENFSRLLFSRVPLKLIRLLLEKLSRNPFRLLFYLRTYGIFCLNDTELQKLCEIFRVNLSNPGRAECIESLRQRFQLTVTRFKEQSTSQQASSAAIVDNNAQLHNVLCSECNRPPSANHPIIRCSINCGCMIHYPICGGLSFKKLLYCKPCTIITIVFALAPKMFHTNIRNPNSNHSISSDRETVPIIDISAEEQSNISLSTSRPAPTGVSHAPRQILNSDDLIFDEIVLNTFDNFENSGMASSSLEVLKLNKLLESERNKCRSLLLDNARNKSRIRVLEEQIMRYHALLLKLKSEAKAERIISRDKTSENMLLRTENAKLLEKLKAKKDKDSDVAAKNSLKSQMKEEISKFIIKELKIEKQQILIYAHEEMEKRFAAFAAVVEADIKANENVNEKCTAVGAAVETEERRKAKIGSRSSSLSERENNDTENVAGQSMVQRMQKKPKHSAIVNFDFSSPRSGDSKDIKYHIRRHEIYSDLYVAFISTDKWIEYLGVFEKSRLKLAEKLASRRRKQLLANAKDTDKLMLPSLSQGPRMYEMGMMV